MTAVHRRAASISMFGDGLLPLLDILFATIGILIVIMVIRNPGSEQHGISHKVDLLLACNDGKAWVLYSDPKTEGIRYPSSEMNSLYDVLGGYPKLNLLVAIGSACFKMKAQFMDSFESRRMTESKPEKGHLKLVRVAFMPLSDSPESITRLRDRWDQVAE